MPGHDRLALLGHEEFEIAAAERRIGGGFRHQPDARHDHGIVLGQNDADIGMARGPVGRVGTENIVAQHEAPVGDTLQNGG
ncbi:hypothetical protein D3C87_2009620 [compost metagenome]